MPNPTRKVALVTGGAIRVGRALSIGLAEAGYDLAVHYHSSSAPARDVERRISELGRRCVLIGADLGEPEGAEQVARAVREQCGRLDLLVNSASSFEEADLLDVDAEAWDRVMNVNLRGPFLLVRAAAPMLRESRGVVVNMCDVLGMEPWTRHPHHSVSKAALLHLTKILAKVLAPEVRVNAVAPGTVLPPPDSGPDFEAKERAGTPLHRIGSPEDVLRTVLFLAASPFVTGEVIVVDGGRRLGS